MISDDGGGTEKVRNSGGRSFQRRGAVLDIARLSVSFSSKAVRKLRLVSVNRLFRYKVKKI